MIVGFFGSFRIRSKYSTKSPLKAPKKPPKRLDYPNLDVTTVQDHRHLLHTAQQAHGLRHNDFSRYHAYTTRKLRRLRKYTKTKFGNKRNVTPVSIDFLLKSEDEANERKFQIAIFEIERCWAAAMEYKQLETNRGNHHSVQRLRKAVKYAKELEEVCDVAGAPLTDARTLLEIKALYSYMKGLLDFELKDWAAAETNITKTRTIYTTLSESVVGFKKVSYTSLCEDLTPSLRFCAYNTGNTEVLKAMRKEGGANNLQLDNKLKALIENAKGEESSKMDVVGWQISKEETGCLSVPIESHLSNVKSSVAGLRENRKQIEGQTSEDSGMDSDGNANQLDLASKLEICDNSLEKCRDAIQIVRSDIHSNSGKTDVIDLEQSNLLLNYLQYFKTLWLCERNIYLADDLQETKKISVMDKPGDFARLFDLVVNQLKDLLEGFKNFGDSSELLVWVTLVCI